MTPTFGAFLDAYGSSSAESYFKDLTPGQGEERVTGVLLALLRRGPGPEAAELAALREEEWTRLVYRAKVHRVAPLIFRRLVTDGLTSAVPASALEFLRCLILHLLTPHSYPGVPPRQT